MLPQRLRPISVTASARKRTSSYKPCCYLGDVVLSAVPDMNEDELRQRLFAWHTANLEFANAASIKELSVRSWDQDDPHELPGAHCFLPGCSLLNHFTIYFPLWAQSWRLLPCNLFSLHFAHCTPRSMIHKIRSKKHGYLKPADKQIEIALT